MTASSCNKTFCFAGEGLECDEGLLLSRCPHFRARETVQGEVNAATLGTRFSWTGDALGLVDISRIAARGRMATLALIGPSDAGKTSFLTTLYLRLLNGNALGGLRFAGSLTLGGWEALAAKMRWSGTEPPGFPSHTPRGAARAPGLLHLSFRTSMGHLMDILLADAPGEWFERWAVDRNDPQAEGARWLEQHADAALVFLDSERLSKPTERGKARTQALQLLSRVAATYRSRPWQALWSKHDCLGLENNPAVKAVEDQLLRLGMSKTFETVSANAGAEARGVLEATSWLINRAHSGVHAEPSTPKVATTNPLLAFRGRAG
jgi:hypothetical protein